MDMRVFRVPDHAAAHLVAYVLGTEGVAACSGVRHRQPYVSVRSDPADIESADVLTARAFEDNLYRTGLTNRADLPNC